MPPMIPNIPQGLIIEIIYSFVIIVSSLMIYISTKELDELSSYKGIKYFRLAFLFFALAYFFRSFIKFFLMFVDLRNLSNLVIYYINIIMLFVFIYASAMSVFYLMYSVIWKKIKNYNKIHYFLHLFAIIIAVVSVVLREISVLIGIHILLLLFVAISTYLAHKNSKGKKGGNLYLIYLLVFIFWTINIVDILVPNFFKLFQIFVYLISIFLFLLILYKVLRKT